jgi:N utilization substance protein B
VTAGRRSSRRQAVFVTYQADLLKLDADAALRRVEDGGVSEYCRRLVAGVEAERILIDSSIEPHLIGWTLGRLGVLERAILRIATYELLREQQIPVPVVIDEAVDVAKRFCSVEAAALVNAVLAGVARELRGPEADGGEARLGDA